jgi:hypothetical protein
MLLGVAILIAVLFLLARPVEPAAARMQAAAE